MLFGRVRPSAAAPEVLMKLLAPPMQSLSDQCQKPHIQQCQGRISCVQLLCWRHQPSKAAMHRRSGWLSGTGTHQQCCQACTAAAAQLHGARPAAIAAQFLMPVSLPASGWTSHPCVCRSPSRNSGSLSQLGSFAEEHQCAANTLPEVQIRPGRHHLCLRRSHLVAWRQACPVGMKPFCLLSLELLNLPA